MITESVVISDRTTVIKKGDDRVLVARFMEFVVVTKVGLSVSEQPFVALAKKYKTPNDAIYDYDRVVGKMVLKKPDSKYFSLPKLNQHLSNGNVEFMDYGMVLKIARDAVVDYERYKAEQNKCV